MAFDLTVATRRTHDREPHVGEGAAGEARAIAITLRGQLDDTALDRIREVLDEQRAEPHASLFVELVAVEAAQPTLAALAELVMRLRRDGVDVQIDSRDPSLEARLRTLPDARDCLVASGIDDEPGARRALHLDGPKLEEP